MPKPARKLLERGIEKPVVAYARQKGVMVTKMTAMGYSSMPDRCFWLPGGKPVLIEFKRPGGVLRPLQLKTVLELRGMGYEVHCVDNVVAGKAIVDGWATKVDLKYRG